MNAEHLTQIGQISIFFTNVGIRAVGLCLICQESVAAFKEYNLKIHFQTKHSNFGGNLSESQLKQKSNDMLRSLKQEQTVCFVKQTTKASFALAYKIAKHNKTVF